MLVNRIGIEDEAVVELDSRRSSVTIHPERYVSMAMVLQTALTTFDTLDSTGAPTRRVAPVSNLTRPVVGRTEAGPESRESAA